MSCDTPTTATPHHEHPFPGLATINELVVRAQAAGVDVTLTDAVDPRELPRAVDMAAYRIIQEALTNVARHADPRVAAVAVHRTDDTLVVSITDVGTDQRRSDALPTGGNGLPGMVSERPRSAAPLWPGPGSELVSPSKRGSP